jgi:hypothetical protein
MGGEGGGRGTWMEEHCGTKVVSGLVENLLFVEEVDVEEATLAGGAETDMNGREKHERIVRHARPMHRILLRVRVLVMFYYVRFSLGLVAVQIRSHYASFV